jgi:acyl transferase domain-containing protein
MDPQHRILLECSYEALENGRHCSHDHERLIFAKLTTLPAGLTIEGIAGGKTGVFMGASYPDYSVHLLRDTETCPMYHGTGTAEALLSNRISYFFDLNGPSMTIETACSSALSSLHMACQSIHAGDSTQAIVGACHLNVIPDTFVSLAKSQ